MKLCIYPGTFDPFTNGHLDVLQRAAKLFGHVRVAVAIDSTKKPLFSPERRVELIQGNLRGLPNVDVVSFDGLLVEFQSVVDAVRCAIEIQRAMPEHGPPLPADRRIRFRVAINIGDVVSDGDLLHGDGIAIAARLESLAEPDGINISRAVRDQVRDRLPLAFADLGEHEVENIARPVRVFRILPAGQPATRGTARYVNPTLNV